MQIANLAVETLSPRSLVRDHRKPICDFHLHFSIFNLGVRAQRFNRIQPRGFPSRK
jgi:hypothetical protein